MKVLYSCPLTNRVLHRFSRTLAFQERYFPDAVRNFDRIIFTDEEIPVMRGWSAVWAPIKISGVYNMARSRNLIFEYADLNGYEWIIDADADRVLLNSPEKFPEPGLAAIATHYTDEGESDEVTYERCKAGRLDFGNGSSFFAIHRSVFCRFRNCEEFLGAGYEDKDFVFNICLPNGVKTVPIHARGLHRHHPNSERFPEYGEFNRILYERRRKQFGAIGGE